MRRKRLPTTEEHDFRVRIAIFDENRAITNEERVIRQSLLHGKLFEHLLEEEFREDDVGSFEVLAADDEVGVGVRQQSKELRLRRSMLYSEFKENEHALYFRQHGEELMSLQELKVMTERIRFRLEQFLGYGLQDPVMYIETGRIS